MPANTGIDTACPCRCARCLSGWLHGYPLAPRGRSWCILRGPPSLKWHECDIGENVARGEVLYRVRNATRERRHLALRAGLGGKPVADLEGTLRELKHTRALEHMRHGAASEHEAWGFEPGFVERRGEHGLPEDSDQHPQYEGYESTCGGIDDSQWVEAYDGTLGVSQAFVAEHRAPVGQIRWNDNLASIFNNPGKEPAPVSRTVQV